jgi:hypothetical protein
MGVAIETFENQRNLLFERTRVVSTRGREYIGHDINIKVG